MTFGLTPVRALAAVALLLALAASFAGSPYVQRRASVDVTALASAVAREEDHVTALELAQWIKERRPGLRVVDVRTAEEYEAYHVPSAERIDLEALTSTPFRAADIIVLYSEGGAHAAQGWVFLRALGYRRVYFLRGGLYEWLEQVMNPVLSADATPAAREQFTRASVLSRYFGGVPRSDVPALRDETIRLTGAIRDSIPRSDVPLPRSATQKRVLEVRRRGC
jgi:rhodanese-related sulfurtransferase